MRKIREWDAIVRSCSTNSEENEAPSQFPIPVTKCFPRIWLETRKPPPVSKLNAPEILGKEQNGRKETRQRQAR